MKTMNNLLQRYIELQTLIKPLEEELEAIKKDIKKYMEDNELKDYDYLGWQVKLLKINSITYPKESIEKSIPEDLLKTIRKETIITQTRITKQKT